MNVETATAEIGLVAQADGGYHLALYHSADNRVIKLSLDPLLAWKICGAIHVPITSAELSTEQL